MKHEPESRALPNGWQRCRLPEFTHIVMGQSPPSITYNRQREGLPFFQGKAEFGALHPKVDKYCSQTRKIATQGATLLSVRAPVGPTNLADRDCCIGRGLAAIHPADSIASRFVLYLMRSIEPTVSDEGTGSTFTAISKDFLHELSFSLPPLNEQTRIIAKIEELFSELDQGVENLKKARAQLTVYRQAVLKHAFEGKLTAQWREEKQDKPEQPEQLLTRIKDEQAARYERQLEEWKTAVKTWETGGKRDKKPAKPKPANHSSPIRQEDRDRLLHLPQGWAWIRLAQLFSTSPQNGVYKPASEYGKGTQIIRIDDFYDGQLIRRSGFKKLCLSNEEIEKYRVRNSDLIINRVNSIEYLGKCALVDFLTENTVFESNIMKCCVIEGVISTAYVAAYLSSHEGRNRLCENAKHAVNQASINQTDVGNTLVPITSTEEQLLIVQKIEQKLYQTDELISQIEGHLKKAEALRQSILKTAFAGKLVAQDPGDEPASVLLDRIKAEREPASKSRETTKRTRNKRKPTA